LPAFSKSLRKARNFSATAIVLLRSYLKATGWRGSAALLGAIGLGFFQPVPLAFLAHIAVLASDGNTSAMTFQGFSLDLSTAFYIAIGMILLEVLMSHGMDRVVLNQNTVWQDHMHKHLIGSAPRSARPYYLVHHTGANNGREYVQIVNRAVTSATVFGRIITRAIKDGTSALVALAVLTWLDVSTLAIIALISCVIVPVYARAAAISAKSRLVNRNLVRDALPAAVAAVEQSPTNSEAGASVEKPVLHFRPLYTLPNQIKLQFSKFRLLSGLNLVAVLLAIFLWNGANVQTLLQTKLIYLAVLVVFLRSVRGISAALALFSQSYSSLATLKAFLIERLKPLPAGKPPDAAVYSVSDAEGRSLRVEPSRPVYVFMQQPRFAFQLTGLSNALTPTSGVANPAAQWLSVYSPGAADTLQASPPRAGWVVNEADWPGAQKAGLGAGECVFIALTEQPGNLPREGAHPTIFLDGDEVVAAGSYSECYNRYAEKLAAAQRKRKRRALEDDELEEMEE